MISTKDLDQIKSLIEEFKPKVTFFERKILVPGVIDRLKYAAQIFDDFKKICANKEVAIHIDAALKRIVSETHYNLAALEPKTAEKYLKTLSDNCTTEFINPINEILSSFSNKDLENNIDDITNFLNTASNFFQSIVGVREKAFLYSLRAFLNVKNQRTGEVILGPPVELAMILMPFQTKIDELVNVAKTTIQSVEEWGKQIGIQKTKHVEIIGNLTQIKVAEQQATAARWSVYVQIATIVFALALVIVTWRVNLYLEKKDLERAVEGLQQNVENCKAEKSKIDGDLVESKNSLSKCKSQIVKPQK